MRVLLLSTVLLCVAACTTSGPPGTSADLTPPVVAERPAVTGTPIALTPSSKPVALPAAAPLPPAPPPAMAAASPPPPAGPDAAFPWPFAGTLSDPFRLPPPRLSLSNFSYDRAHVEAVVTANADCGARDSGVVATSEFDLAYNGTRTITAPIGNDVCWRRDLAADQGSGEAAPNWSRWNRAYLSAGRSVDSRL